MLKKQTTLQLFSPKHFSAKLHKHTLVKKHRYCFHVTLKDVFFRVLFCPKPHTLGSFSDIVCPHSSATETTRGVYFLQNYTEGKPGPIDLVTLLNSYWRG